MRRPYSGNEMFSILKRGVVNGWWTVADLDNPPPGWTETNKPHRDQHMRTPPRPWTNPLREEDTF